ncbi:MAG: ferritin-like domain-containing protein [bacterium]
MGTFSRKIITVDVNELVKLLNKAFADEWLAYYQYWIGAKVVSGPMRPSVVAELEEHATEELKHALMLTDRIIQLGGTPILKPEDWYKQTNCGYESPKNDFYVKEILEQNIKGEQCAISTYQKIIDFVHTKDYATYDIALKILEDEIKHEEDLEMLLEDLKLMQSKFSK